MPKSFANPQIPGVSTQQTEDDASSAAEVVSVPKATLDALLARVAALESTPQVARRPASEANLPDAADINADTLKSPVLTKQGWLVPEKPGATPVAQNT